MNQADVMTIPIRTKHAVKLIAEINALFAKAKIKEWSKEYPLLSEIVTNVTSLIGRQTPEPTAEAPEKS